jgi:hypothetical protein
MLLVQDRFGSSRASALAAIAVAGVAGIATFVALLVPLAGMRPGTLLRRRGARG